MEGFFGKVLGKAKAAASRFEELESLICSPEIIADNRLYRRLCLEKVDLEDTVSTYERLIKALALKEEYQREEEAADEEFKKLLSALSEENERDIAFLSKELTVLLLPDGGGDKNAKLEVRLFEGQGGRLIGDLLSAYTSLSEKNGYNLSLLEKSCLDDGLMRSFVILVSGKGVFGRLKHESGLHKAIERTQKTSAAVTVLPEEEIINEEIKSRDLRVDLFHSGGAGGQNINKVETAIRLTHYPTGIVVTCQDERSQLKNKERALRILAEKVNAYYRKKQEELYLQAREEQREKVEKRERVRTYNYINNTVVDHRSDVTIKLNEVVTAGGLDILIDAIILQ